MALFRRHALFCIKRGEAIPAMEPRGDVTLRVVTRENVGDIRSFRPELADTFARQLDKGQLGLYAYVDGQVVGHLWLIPNRGESSLRANGYFRLRPREALAHFASVAESHRGLGIFQAILCEMYRRAFAEEPIDTIYIDTVIDNMPSRKAIGKTARFVSHAYYVNVLSRGYRLPW